MGEQGQPEVEWQFDVPDLDAVAAVLERRELAGYEVRRGPVRELEDLYFDTRRWRIHGAGFTARLRSGEGRRRLTLKSIQARAAGPRRRREYEEEVVRPGLRQLSQVPGAAGHLLRLIGEGSGYRELFTVRTRRRTFRVEQNGVEIAEVALDATACYPPGASEAARSLRRVEVEAVPGAADSLVLPFADLLARIAVLQPAAESKFEAGLIAARLTVPIPGRNGGLPARGMTVDEAARAILSGQLRALLLNEPGARLGLDPGPLHDLRVAARRMRAALSLFEGELPRSLTDYRREARWIGSISGRLRDLDVHLDGLAKDRAAATVIDGPAFAELVGLLSEDRERTRRTLVRGLASPRFGRFAAGLEQELSEGEDRAAGRTPLLEVAPRILAQRYAELRKRRRPIGPSSPPHAYHRLRISAKKLRYALEFFAPLYGAPLKRYRTRIGALQDLLGEHQDADVGARLLEDLAARRGERLSAGTREAMAALAARRRQRAAQLRERFDDVFGGLQGRAWRRVVESCERDAPSPAKVAPDDIRASGG